MNKNISELCSLFLPILQENLEDYQNVPNSNKWKYLCGISIILLLLLTFIIWRGIPPLYPLSHSASRSEYE